MRVEEHQLIVYVMFHQLLPEELNGDLGVAVREVDGGRFTPLLNQIGVKQKSPK